MNVLVDGEIVLFGTVGEELFEEGFTALDVVRALAQVGRANDVTVRINSGGGYADEGLAIFNALKAHRGKVTTVVESVAASAASVLAMAGDEVVMKTGSYMMVHDPEGITAGNSAEHAKGIEWLETIATAMADCYSEKTRRTPDDVRADMKSEVWMSAKECVARGYADKIDKGRAKEPMAFDYQNYQHAPERMVALAQSRGWKRSGSKAESSATHGQTQETEMTDAEKVAADKLAADKAAADKAAADAQAAADKAAAEKAAADKAAVDAAAKETEDKVTANNKRAADIAAACAIAGQPMKATAFITEGKSVTEVLAALAAERKPTASEEVSARHAVTAQEATASWNRQIERANARVPNGRAG